MDNSAGMTDAALTEAARWFNSMNPGIYTTSEKLGQALIAEVKRLREKQNELNRRCQAAESAARAKVDEAIKAGPSIGRGLANWAATDLRRRLEGGEILLQSSEAAVARLTRERDADKTEIEANRLTLERARGDMARLLRERDDALASKEAADQAVDSLLVENAGLKKDLDEVKATLSRHDFELEAALKRAREWAGLAGLAEGQRDKNKRELDAAHVLLGDRLLQRAAIELERDSLKARLNEEAACRMNVEEREHNCRGVLHRIYRALHRDNPAYPPEGCSMLSLDLSVRDMVADHDAARTQNIELGDAARIHERRIKTLEAERNDACDRLAKVAEVIEPKS